MKNHSLFQSLLSTLTFTLIAFSAVANTEQVQLNGKVSQSVLVQHSDNTVYLDITIKAPVHAITNAQIRPTDMVIILDRSGSMQAEKKIDFAKAAIHDVLAQLTPNDRFALVSFSDNAIVHSPIVAINPANRENLNRIVDTIPADGSTNMSDGLQSALKLLSDKHDNERVKKALLLSDGQANQGIIDPQGLASIVQQITKTGAVLSTIGMGLDFNETLMTALADYGMGHYSYLEQLSGLGAILAKDLTDTRSIYAAASTLDVTLSNGVALIDAGGYPLTQVNANTVRITTGQILDNTDKHFVMTFTIPNQKTGALSLGQLQLNYQAGKEPSQIRLADDSVKLSIVEPSKRTEALKSVDSTIYKKTWSENNLGRMKKTLSDSVREGDKAKAQQAITDYRQAAEKAQKESNVPLLSPEVEGELNKMNADVEESFKGDAVEQDIKRKRSSKIIQKEAVTQQRK
jgi:Ca-activated chloride channel family protein